MAPTGPKAVTESNIVGPTYYVDVEICGQPTKLLIDTGSVVSILTDDFVRQYMDINKMVTAEQLNMSTRFSTASGEELQYMGAIEASIVFTDFDLFLPSSFLVIPSHSNATSILGTNILEMIHPETVLGHRQLHKACSLVHQLNNKFNQVRAPSGKTRIPANTIIFDTATVKVIPAKFARTVVISPTDEAMEMSNLCFVSSCIVIPPMVTSVDVPYRIGNVTNSYAVIQKHFPIFDINTVDYVCSVKSSTDPRQLTMSDEDFIDLFEIDFSTFTPIESEEIRRVLLKHKSLFALNDYQLGCLKDVKYHIEMKDDVTPIKQRYRPLHPNLRNQVRDQLNVMTETGVISESTSAWSSPLTVAKKKDGTLRLCVDYRLLNAQAKRDAKPLPRIEETLSLLNGNTYFSSCDLISGYWQLMLDDESKQLTAFSAGSESLYEFNRVPFGYSASGAHFQRSIENVLRDVMYQHCLVYLDDVLVKSPDFISHVDSLDCVFTKLYDSGLRLKPKKCRLFTKEVKFLGFLVTPKGIYTDPDKTKLIDEWPIPVCTKDVRRYLGLIGYYRKFVPQFAHKAAPLTKLLKGKLVKRGAHKMFVPVQFYWNEEQQQAFDGLRRALLEDVCLTHPDYSKPFVLEIDASRGALGAVLSQEVDNKLRPIAFASRKTNTAESNYPAHRLEFLALRWAVTSKFQDYLQYSKFEVRTDSNPLSYILKKLHLDAVSQRWAAELCKFDFDIVYRTGKSNTAADSLSRLNDPSCDEEAVKLWCEKKSKSVNLVKTILQGSSDDSAKTDQVLLSETGHDDDKLLEQARLLVQANDQMSWSKIQSDDPNIQFAIKNIVDKDIKYKDVVKQNKIIKSLYKVRTSLVLRNGLLYRRIKKQTVCDQLVLNDGCLPVLFHYYHDLQNHLGEDRTVCIFQERFYWPRMTTQVRNLVKCCTTCQSRKVLPAKNKDQMYHRPECSAPMEIISVDHLVVTNQDASMQCLTIVDEFTKFLFIIPVHNLKARTTADAIIKNVFNRYGYPRIIHSDNASSFCNKIMDDLYALCGVKRSTTVPYHSQGNSVCERANSVVLNLFGTLPAHKKKTWYKYADVAAYCFNTSVHASTGFSPFYLLFGRKPRLIGDALLNICFEHQTTANSKVYLKNLHLAHQLCKERLQREHVKYKEIYDNKHRSLISLEDGDIVLIRNFKPQNKIENRWDSSPFVVVCKPEPDIPVYRVKDIASGTVKLCHRNQLLPLFQCEDLVTPIKQKHVESESPSVSDDTDTHKEKEEADTETVECSGDGVVIHQPLNDVDSDGSNTEERVSSTPRPIDSDTPDTQDEISSNSDESSSDSPPDSPPKDDIDVYRTRSGRAIRPPERYTPSKPSKALMFAIFGDA